MAGSYRHCRDDDTAQFRFDLIENMGDAREACKMMFFMIGFLAANENEIADAETAYFQRERGA